MSPKFECFVEISDKRYDIIVEDFGFNIKFSEIYPKIQQIVKIAINEDITFITHKFEILELLCLPTEPKIVTEVDQIVGHKSTIRITPKRLEVNCYPSLMTTKTVSSLPKCDGQQTDSESDKYVAKEMNYLQKNKVEIEIFYNTIKAINIDWDMKSGYHNWEKVAQRMKEWNNFYSNEKTFYKNIVYKWTQYYAKHFYKLDGKLSPKSQPIFDLLKVIHILYLDKLYDKNDPILDRIIDISQKPQFICYYEMFLKDIRIEKILTKEIEKTHKQINSQNANTVIPFSSPLSQTVTPNQQFYKLSSHSMTQLNDSNIIGIPSDQKNKSKCNRIVNSAEVQHLFQMVRDVEAYKAIVMAINIGWDLKGSQNWDKVFERLGDGWKTLKNAEHCILTFHKWTHFYAQFYSKLNGVIQPKAQEIFDLLKIVHILDLDQIYDKSHPIPQQIEDISQKPELKDYFLRHLKVLRNNKIKFKKVNTSVRQSISIPPSLICPSTYSPRQSIEISIKTKSLQNTVDNNKVLPTTTTTNSNQYISQSQRSSLREEPLLKEKVNEIKDFHTIVLAINIEWDFRKNGENWNKVSKTINEKRFTQIYCSNKFFLWTKYYAQNYDSFDGKLEPSYQKIFDLLKVVHTLNLNRVYSPSNQTALKIKEISFTIQFIQYFEQNLREMFSTKLQSKEMEANETKVSEKHLKSFEKLKQISNSSTKISLNDNNFESNIKNSNKSYESIPKSRPLSTENTSSNSNISQRADQSDYVRESWLKVMKYYQTLDKSKNEQTVKQIPNKYSNPNKRQKTNKILK